MKRKLITDVFFHVAGNAISKLLIIFINFYLASELGKYGFGEFSYIQNTIMTMAGVGVMGITSAMTYYFATKEKSESISLLMTVLICINIIMLPVFIFFGTSEILVSTCVFAVVNYSVFSGALIGNKVFNKLAIVNFLSVLIFLISVIIIEDISYIDALNMFALYKVVLLLSSVYIFIQDGICINGLELNYEKIISNIKEVYSYALPIAASSFMVGPVIWFGNSMLMMTENGSESFGIYSFAYQIYLMLIFIPSVLSSLYLSYLSKSSVNILKVSFLFNFLVVSILSFVCHIFLTFYFKYNVTEYSSVKDFIFYFYISAIIYSVSSVVGQKILSEKKVWVNFIFNFVWAMSYISLLLPLVNIMGAESLPIALMISYIIQITLQALYIYRKS